MKIALVTEHVSPYPGKGGTDVAAQPGSQAQRVSQLARTLAGLGHTVTIYGRKDSPALPRQAAAAPGVTIEHVTAGSTGQVPAGQPLGHLAAFSEQLARRWRQNQPDVVHAHYWTGGLAALAAARGLPVPVVQTFHSLGTAEQRQGVGPAGQPGPDQAARVKLEALIARRVKAVLASCSGELAELASLGVPRSAIKVVPYGIDTTEFGPDGPVARRTRKPRLMAVTPLLDHRQLDPVVRALALIPGAELVIVGGPPRTQLPGDLGYRRLIRLAGQLGVADRVTCTGQVSRPRMPALLRSADLLVHIARYEPFGMVPLQAMACGTPVLAAADGSHSDAVVDGATGALIEQDKPVTLARLIRKLLASPMLLEGYGIAAADRVRARYSWDRVGREMLAAYAGSVRGAASPEPAQVA